MFGWRKRIGYIGPTVVELVAYDFYRFVPDGVGLVGVTCNIDDWGPEHFERALAQVTAAAGYLGSRAVDFVVHGGGPLVVKRGPGFEETIVREIEAAAKVPATTGVRAAMEALRHVGAHRVAMASPYPRQQDEAMAAYLAAKGFEVMESEGLGLPFKAIQNMAPAEIYRFANRIIASAKGCEALFLPCAQWQGAAVVEALEQDNGIPVIACTHANFFAALNTLNVRAPIKGHGRLLASLAERKAA
jgi:maleate cis-trans isomerase